MKIKVWLVALLLLSVVPLYGADNVTTILVTNNFVCGLTAAELAGKTAELDAVQQQIDKTEGQLFETLTALRTTLADLLAKRDAIAVDLRDQRAVRPVECAIKIDLNSSEIITVRNDTKTVIASQSIAAAVPRTKPSYTVEVEGLNEKAERVVMLKSDKFATSEDAMVWVDKTSHNPDILPKEPVFFMVTFDGKKTTREVLKELP